MILVCLYIIFCVILAYINYRRIVADKRIYHALNGLAHLACWIGSYFLLKNLILTLSFPFLGRLFFDTGLSLMRGLPVDYVARKPKSIIDKIEKAIFKMDGITPKVIYFAIVIALTIVHHRLNPTP